jgi:tetratricopeptide (TPR) repeat protein
MIFMDSRQAELSRSIEKGLLGQRIRNARIAAGLTQGQLGHAADVTTAYISRIEAGDRRPEASRLEAMAGALGVSLDALVGPEETDSVALELRVDLDHAQLALSAGSVEEAATAVERILDKLDQSPASASVRWQAEFIGALCEEARGKMDEAIVALKRLSENPRPDALWVKVLIALSRCYREVGDTERAISVGEDAMETLAGLGLLHVTETIQLAVTVASAYAAQGDVDHAARICLRAVDDAVAIGSPVAQGSAYWNASVMEARRGLPESAVSLASKAVALFELADDRRNMGRLRTDLALMQMSMDPPQLDEAWANLEHGRRELEWSSATPADHGRNRLVAARVLAGRGQLDLAVAAVDEVLAIDTASAPMLIAEAQVARGQWLADLGRVDEALLNFRDAVLIASGIGADRDAGQFWFDLAEIFDRYGDQDSARDAYRRAAASVGLASRRARQLR